MNKTITRIAPTPSGFLHIGNIYSFLLTYFLSKSKDADLILRIDDIDKSRYRKEYLEDIFETLRFFEISYQKGPLSETDFEKNFSQHQRISLYMEVINKLKSAGLLYACTCSRTDIINTYEGIYCKNNCREKQIPFNTADVAWKIKLPANCVVHFNDMVLGAVEISLNKDIGDFVILRKEGIPSYQIASLCDDVSMKVNLIVRGEDLLPSTAAQIFLAQQLGYDKFIQTSFLHHPLLKSKSGKKLAKSKNSFSINEMRREGKTKQNIIELIKEHSQTHYSKNNLFANFL
jgi:glutamyl-tRNA synthetase